jgi:VWFA-related protein
MRIVNRSALLVFFFLAGLAAPGVLHAQAPEGPLAPRPGQTIQQAPASAQVKVRVTLVNTPVTVRDLQGNLVDNLAAADFHLTDNGVEQKISHFDFGGDPISVVILIETSSRIDPLLPEMRKTGVLFTQTVMGADGEAAVVGFNDGVDKLQNFTRNSDAIDTTVAQLQTGGSGSKLYDAMGIAVDMLARRPQATADKPGRRRVLFVLSETLDVGSETKLGEVLRRAQLANVTIYSVGLSTARAELHSPPRNTQPDRSTPPGINPLPPMPGSIQTPETEAARNTGVDLMGGAIWAVQHIDDKVKDRAMEVAAVATGGAHLSTYKDRSIENAIDELGAELHSQYTVSYAPSDGSDFGYHEIKVQVNRKGVTVRARPGYYITPPG